MTSPIHNPAYSKLIWRAAGDSREKVFTHIVHGNGEPILFIGDTGLSPHIYDNTLEVLSTRGKVYAPAPKTYRHLAQFVKYIEMTDCKPAHVIAHGTGSRTITRLLADASPVSCQGRARDLHEAFRYAHFSLLEPERIYWQSFPAGSSVDVLVTDATQIDPILAQRRKRTEELFVSIHRARAENELVAAIRADLHRQN